MIHRFILNEVSYFGPGSRRELITEINRMGAKKAMIVTDPGLLKFGVAKMVTDVLDEAGFPYAVSPKSNPTPRFQM